MEPTPGRAVGQPGTGNAQNLPEYLQKHGQKPYGLILFIP